MSSQHPRALGWADGAMGHQPDDCFGWDPHEANQYRTGYEGGVASRARHQSGSIVHLRHPRRIEQLSLTGKPESIAQLEIRAARDNVRTRQAQPGDFADLPIFASTEQLDLFATA